MPASDYLDRRVLEWGFASGAFPAAPGGVRYVALYTSPPGKAGGGTECSGGGYVRLATADALWTVSGPTWRATNAATLTFGTPTTSWGTLVAFGLLDAAVGGELLWYGALAAQRTPAVGQPVVFGAGSLAILGQTT